MSLRNTVIHNTIRCESLTFCPLLYQTEESKVYVGKKKKFCMQKNPALDSDICVSFGVFLKNI